MTSKPEYRHTVYHSPVGIVYLLTNGRSILALGLNESTRKFEERCQKVAPGEWHKIDAEEDDLLKTAIGALDAFFQDDKPFPSDLRLKPHGTRFQHKVWKELRRIPYGRTATYGQIAKKVGSPDAARAVGLACGANPIPLFIPCHRVVGSSGSLCGFGGGGIEVKRKLLDLERAQREIKF